MEKFYTLSHQKPYMYLNVFVLLDYNPLKVVGGFFLGNRQWGVLEKGC